MQHLGTEDQMKQAWRDFLATLPPEERLEGLSPEERLEAWRRKNGMRVAQTFPAPTRHPRNGSKACRRRRTRLKGLSARNSSGRSGAASRPTRHPSTARRPVRRRNASRACRRRNWSVCGDCCKADQSKRLVAPAYRIADKLKQGLRSVGAARTQAKCEGNNVMDPQLIRVPVELKRLSCSPVLEENLFDIGKSEFPCPGQWCRPRLVIGQVGRGTALEQELDHPSPSLGQLGLFRCRARNERPRPRASRGIRGRGR